jgi:hypothetical protein
MLFYPSDTELWGGASYAISLVSVRMLVRVPYAAMQVVQP